MKSSALGIIPLLLSGLLCIAMPARAWHADLGLQYWNVDVSTPGVALLDGSAHLYGARGSITLDAVRFSASYLQGDMKLEQEENDARRRDIDLLVDYSFLRHFMLFFGYKQIRTEIDYMVNDDTEHYNETNNAWLLGGMVYHAFTTGTTPYLMAGYMPVNTINEEYSNPEIDEESHDGTGWSVEAGISQSFGSSPVSARIAYRHNELQHDLTADASRDYTYKGLFAGVSIRLH